MVKTKKVALPMIVFVHNLPERMHWKGLWTSLAHHGDVIDAFIPKKRSKSGRRFGFVRFTSKADTNRAIYRLNGFSLFAYRVSVSYENFRSRTSFWRKVNLFQQGSDLSMKQHLNPSKQTISNDERKSPTHLVFVQENDCKSLEIKQENSTSCHNLTSNFRDQEKVKGYVEVETLWKLQHCLIGYTAVDSDAVKVQDRLGTWGL
ncbi:hypothetical protein V6N13_022072 [Hibiscus sabdariffa]